MSAEDKFYEQALDELEGDNKVRSVWAKAFALSDDENGAKRLYIRYRVAELQGEQTSEQSFEPRQRDDKQIKLSKDNASSASQKDYQNKKKKKSSFVSNLIYLSLLIPPARLFGAWIVSQNASYPFDAWEVLEPQLENGLTWFTVLWPLAFIYALFKMSNWFVNDDIGQRVDGLNSLSSEPESEGEPWLQIIFIILLPILLYSLVLLFR